MKADLSQSTLGLLRRILEELQPEGYFEGDIVQFWRNELFDFGFAPMVIDVAASYSFKWGEIIPDLFVGRFGRQNSYFSDAMSPSFCEQTLKRLAAFGLFHSRGVALGDKFRKSLGEDGFDLKSDSNSDLSVPAEIQHKLNSPLSSTELEITNVVLDRFLNLHESSPRKPLVIEFRTPDVLDRLVQCSILKVQDREHYLPLSLAFHYSGNVAALGRAMRSVEITLHVLHNLYQVEPNKPESYFTVEEVETHARKMYEKFEPDSLKLGLYLVQELSGVLDGWGCNTQGTEVTFVRISERIVTLNIDAAWGELIGLRKSFIEREQLKKILPRDDRVRRNTTTPSSETADSAPKSQLPSLDATKDDKPVVNFVALQSVEDYVEKSGKFRTDCASLTIPGSDSGGASALYIPYCKKQRFDFGPTLNDYRVNGVFTPPEMGKPIHPMDFVVYGEHFHDIHCPHPCRGYSDRRVVAPEKLAPQVPKDAADSSAGKWTKKEIVAAVVVPLLAVLVGSVLALMTPEVRRWLHLDKPQEQQAPIQSVPAPMPRNDSTPTNAPAEKHAKTNKVTATRITSSVLDWHDKHNWRKYLHTGMTRTDVRAIFGEPEKMRVFSNLETWDYGSGSIDFFVEKSTPDGSLYSWDEPN